MKQFCGSLPGESLSSLASPPCAAAVGAYSLRTADRSAEGICSHSAAKVSSFYASASVSHEPERSSPILEGGISCLNRVSHPTPPAEDAVNPEEEAAYTADLKCLRYMSFTAITKAAVNHVLRNFFPDNAEFAAEVARGSIFTEAAGRGMRDSHFQISSDAPFLVQNRYGQLAERVSRLKNTAPASHARRQGEVCPAIAPVSDRPSSASAGSSLPCRRLMHDEALSLVSSTCASSRNLPLVSRNREETEVKDTEDITDSISTSVPPQEALAGIISLDKLAMLDAGVYVRPILSEILDSCKESHQVAAMLKRCEDIDAKVRELKKKARVRKTAPDLKSSNRNFAEGEATGSSCEGRDVAEAVSTKITAVRGPDTCRLISKTAVKVTPSPCVSVSLHMSERHSSQSGLMYVAAASAEIAMLHQEKRQLRRQLADVQALILYVWKCGGFQPTSRLDAEQFSRLFCSNKADVSQHRVAAVLFGLCDTRHQGAVTAEEVFHRMPLRALEVMFVVTEMKRKARQRYRYSCI